MTGIKGRTRPSSADAVIIIVSALATMLDPNVTSCRIVMRCVRRATLI